MISFKDIIKDMGRNFKPNVLDTLEPIVIIGNLFVVLVCISFVYFIYKKTYSSILYSKNFNITLVMTSLVTSLAVMVISSNLALSLGMVGALSIIRFRSAIKDPKDVGFLFWSVALGIVCGIGAYPLAFISTLVIGLVVFIISKKITVYNSYILVLDFEEKKQEINLTEKIDLMLKKFCYNFKIRSSSYMNQKDEKVYEIKIKEINIKSLISELKKNNSVKKINIFSYEGELSD
ncbi:MAG: DUF4956 domain-containing protein [Spirochaetes bacterium]|nr:DUF4956 domain-containing protein [Spirochaetota bacterium]